MKPYPRYTLRVPRSMLDRVAFVAKYNGRTKNKEIEFIVRKYLCDWERMHGQIPNIEDDEKIQ